MISGKLKLKICIFGPFFMSLTLEVPYLNEKLTEFITSRKINGYCMVGVTRAAISVTVGQTAKYGILDEISLVRDRSGWCEFGADYGILVRCGADLAWWCGAD